MEGKWFIPFNPDKVLTQIPKPVAVPTVPVITTSEIDVCSQGEVLQTPTLPTGLSSLHIQIRQDACADDEASKQRVLRQTQKLINAVETSFAERAIQRDQIQFLRKVNNEGKVRRATKSLVIGKAKVMSYEDLEEARAQRAVKEAANVKGKGTRGRKRKSPATIDDESGPIAKAARASQVPMPMVTPVTWRDETRIAPVARMI